MWQINGSFAPECSICGKLKVVDNSDNFVVRYLCPECEMEDSEKSSENQEKVPCNCDLYEVIMTTGCKDPLHY